MRGERQIRKKGLMVGPLACFKGIYLSRFTFYNLFLQAFSITFNLKSILSLILYTLAILSERNG